ncbi:hypothetical protein F2P79_008222 [Pimephales promelas]|nr:hypothetical protein F2P79_008222 [Pimephales promelas]
MIFITCLVLLKGIEQWVVQLWPFKSPLISIHSCPHPSLLSRIQPHIYQLAFSATKASGFRRTARSERREALYEGRLREKNIKRQHNPEAEECSWVDFMWPPGFFSSLTHFQSTLRGLQSLLNGIAKGNAAVAGASIISTTVDCTLA